VSNRLLAAAIVTAFIAIADAADAQTAAGTSGIIGVNPPQLFELTATCAIDVTPQKAAIVGGVAAGALKPAEAIEQLDHQLEAVRAYVTEQGGDLRLLERVRTVRTPPAHSSNREPPFIVVQRLRADFAASAPVDTILQRLIELGLDRFGDNVLADAGSRRETVIRFTIADLAATVSELRQRCTTEAWTTWCATTDDQSACAAEPPPTLQFQTLSVRSEEKVLRADGGADYWRFNVHRGQPHVEAPELVGNVTLHLTGTISLLYRKDVTP
jgi:hypothetical protein